MIMCVNKALSDKQIMAAIKKNTNFTPSIEYYSRESSRAQWHYAQCGIIWNDGDCDVTWLQTPPWGRQIYDSYHYIISAIARHGPNIILDDVFFLLWYDAADGESSLMRHCDDRFLFGLVACIGCVQHVAYIIPIDYVSMAYQPYASLYTYHQLHTIAYTRAIIIVIITSCSTWYDHIIIITIDVIQQSPTNWEW